MTMNKRGFSIVELVVVITIIGILLTLAAVSFRGYQADARNEERRIRAENIVRYLEDIYKTGSANPSVTQGTYPTTSLIGTYSSSLTVDETKLVQLFGKNGFDLTNLKSAGKDSYGFRIASTNSELTNVAVDEYVYQPIYYYASGNTYRCYYSSWECRSFNLYYATEEGGTTVAHKISSTH